MKRAVDLVLGSLLFLAALPVIAVLAVGLALSLRAWPFFVQQRVGRNGQPFRFLKLRTLPPSVPTYADKYEIRGVPLPWLPRQVRRLHLDELPQLAHVVAGTMSLVGPRPEMPALHRQLPRWFAQVRTSVRPGCTGLWQVGAHAARLIGEAPQYDSVYIERGGLRLDIWIMWRTLLLLSGLRDGVPLSSVPERALVSPRSHVSVREVTKERAAISDVPAA